MSVESHKASTIEDARQLMGIPRPNADALIALLCSWDMGYRTPSGLVNMAGKLVSSQQHSVQGE